MKKSETPPEKIPRPNSLLDQLQRARHPGADQSHFENLMEFLENPPAGTADRFREGASLCKLWGILTSRTSVWRMYRTTVVEWRVRLALRDEGVVDDPKALAKKMAHLTALRQCELLANPDTHPDTIVALLHLELRRKALELAREKAEDARRNKTERAMTELEARVRRHHHAQQSLERLKKALDYPPSVKPPYPPKFLATFQEPPFMKAKPEAPPPPGRPLSKEFWNKLAEEFGPIPKPDDAPPPNAPQPKQETLTAPPKK